MIRLLCVAMVLLAIGSSQVVEAKEYSLKKGQTMTLSCTATPPAGTITHAFFQVVNPEDANYLGINFNSWECRATLFGLKAKSRIAVEVSYSYSYRGTYDNNMHVGSGSYIDYVTVTGAGEATSIKVREGSKLILAPGQSKTLHIDFYPSGSEGRVDWGFLDVFGDPFCFDLKYDKNGFDVIVTGKKSGSAYLLALLNGDQSTVNVVEVVCDNSAASEVLPSSISVSPHNLSMTVGEKQTLMVSYNPDNSFSKVNWTTSDASVATVDADGLVTAIKKGTAVITATSENGVSSDAVIIVNPKATGFTVNNMVEVMLGYSYQLMPDVTPTGAAAVFKYKSSNTAVAKVSSTGLVTALREGVADITVSCEDVDTEKIVSVKVCKPVKGGDYRDARVRLQAVKSLFNQTVVIK